MSAEREEASATKSINTSESDKIGKNNNNSASLLLQGYSFVGIGILLLGSPIISLLFSSDSDNYFWDDDGRPYLRVLTFLPGILLICICHWVSLRIYLRR